MVLKRSWQVRLVDFAQYSVGVILPMYITKKSKLIGHYQRSNRKHTLIFLGSIYAFDMFEVLETESDFVV